MLRGIVSRSVKRVNRPPGAINYRLGNFPSFGWRELEPLSTIGVSLERRVRLSLNLNCEEGRQLAHTAKIEASGAT